MKNLLKIGLLASIIAVFVSGCSGCGDRTKPSTEKIDTSNKSVDSPKKTVDTTKAAIDTTKKDTSKSSDYSFEWCFKVTVHGRLLVFMVNTTNYMDKI